MSSLDISAKILRQLQGVTCLGSRDIQCEAQVTEAEAVATWYAVPTDDGTAYRCPRCQRDWDRTCSLLTLRHACCVCGATADTAAILHPESGWKCPEGGEGDDPPLYCPGCAEAGIQRLRAAVVGVEPDGGTHRAYSRGLDARIGGACLVGVIALCFVSYVVQWLAGGR